MSVTVRFIEGKAQDFPQATSATNRGPIFTVAKHDSTKRDLAEVKSFLSKDVTVAEVFEGGALKRIVNGSGQSHFDPRD